MLPDLHIVSKLFVFVQIPSTHSISGYEEHLVDSQRCIQGPMKQFHFLIDMLTHLAKHTKQRLNVCMTTKETFHPIHQQYIQTVERGENMVTFSLWVSLKQFVKLTLYSSFILNIGINYQCYVCKSLEPHGHHMILQTKPFKVSSAVTSDCTCNGDK